jgi:hypothetical protein
MTLTPVTTGRKVNMINHKMPRIYAAEYMACKTKEERQAIADSVPEHLKRLVQLHIKISKERERMK